MTTLVLLPGMDGTGKLFQPFVAQWADTCRIQVVSYPGDVCLAYSTLADFVCEVLPKDEDFFLLGESFSGPVAVLVASRRPMGLRGLILVCSFVQPPLLLSSWLKPLTRFMPAPSMVLPLLARALMGKYGSAALRQALEHSLLSVQLNVMRARAEAALTVNVSAELKSLTCPVLYLQAMNDDVISDRSVALVQAACPGLVHVQLNGPHFLLQTHAQAAAVAISQFTLLHGG